MTLIRIQNPLQIVRRRSRTHGEWLNGSTKTGTREPWFLIIDPNDRVVFGDFQINADGAIELLQNATDTQT